MPSHKVHRRLLELVLGKEEAKRYRWVDFAMDSTVRLHGRGHRKDPVHDPLTILLMSGGDWKAGLAAEMHQWLDTKASKNPGLKRFLELTS